jgi:hypothetical protein
MITETPASIAEIVCSAITRDRASTRGVVRACVGPPAAGEHDVTGVNIEHEDADCPRVEGLRLAAENLRAAAAKL